MQNEAARRMPRRSICEYVEEVDPGLRRGRLCQQSYAKKNPFVL